MELLINDFTRGSNNDITMSKTLARKDKLKFDLDDYRASNVIGEFATDVCCDVWGDMYFTEKEVLNAWYKALSELILVGLTDYDCNMQRSVYVRKQYKNLWENCVFNHVKAMELFYNNMRCEGDKTTGINAMPFRYIIPESWVGLQPFESENNSIVDISEDVDFGPINNSFSSALWEAKKTSYLDMVCCTRSFLKVIYQFDFERGLPPNADTLDINQWPTEYPDIT